ncbi:hypothetical protein JOD02_001266 [Caldicoprobacter guelmensis]|uniref:hypothetical protein n=1 Tax=Caldicoprobacter guelmensis TaxID=1170224 RepID=UPI00195D34FC|nr:hypothetical protein [Caldicoprobacter guelmensis]MBM7582409.1 hypothetical protein [Caldicoprobacter guelmensis]
MDAVILAGHNTSDLVNRCTNAHDDLCYPIVEKSANDMQGPMLDLKMGHSLGTIYMEMAEKYLYN